MTNKELLEENEKLKDILIRNGLMEKDKIELKKSYSFSKMTDAKLEECVNLKRKFRQDILKIGLIPTMKLLKI
jgi:hypothetical protein